MKKILLISLLFVVNDYFAQVTPPRPTTSTVTLTGAVTGVGTSTIVTTFKTSPTFAGTVTAPSLSVSVSGVTTYTLSSTDSSTSIANTKWVKQRLVGMGSGSNISNANLTFAASYTTTVGPSYRWTLKGGEFYRVGEGATDGTINATFNNSSGKELFKIKNGGAIELGSYLSGSGNGSIFMNANALSDTYVMNVLYSTATTNTGSNSSFALRLDASGYPTLRTSKQRMVLGANGLDGGTGTELYIDYGSHRFLLYDDATLIANIDRDNGISLTPDAGTGVIIGAGVSSLTGSAALQVNSTTQGFLLPRMTTTQKNTMSPSSTNDKGLMVFDTTLGKVCVWNGTAWETITSL